MHWTLPELRTIYSADTRQNWQTTPKKARSHACRKLGVVAAKTGTTMEQWHAWLLSCNHLARCLKHQLLAFVRCIKSIDAIIHWSHVYYFPNSTHKRSLQLKDSKGRNLWKHWLHIKHWHGILLLIIHHVPKLIIKLAQAAIRYFSFAWRCCCLSSPCSSITRWHMNEHPKAHGKCQTLALGSPIET